VPGNNKKACADSGRVFDEAAPAVVFGGMHEDGYLIVTETVAWSI
jgi:hypothetical protein